MRACFFEECLLLWLGGIRAFARDLLFARFCSAAFIAVVLVCSAFAPTAQGQVQVFRCTVDGVVTFSDRPCSADAQPYEADDARVSTFAAPPATAVPKTLARAKTVGTAKRDSTAAAQAKHAESCARIERSLRDIRSKMRAGYTAKQGERLNERERKLSARRREQKC